MSATKLRLVCLALGIAMLLTALPLGALGDDDAKVTVIVLFKDKVDEDLIKDHGGKITTEYTLIPAVVTKLKQKDIDDLKEDANIKSIEEDTIVSILGTVDDEGRKPAPPPETLPTGEHMWGMTKIDAELAWADAGALKTKVAVLDTGIDTDHSEFKDSNGVSIIKDGTSYVTGVSSYEDDNGHGTHCAGIIAAAHDDSGVVGVAAGFVDLYAVKVLGSTGSGYYSWIVSGIQWAVDRVDVISMSLSGPTNDDVLKAACDAAMESNVIVVAAAGNSGKKATNLDKVEYPGRYDSVIAVGATDSNDVRATWSSTGPAVDFAAPGVGVWSTYPGGVYAKMSGTSMACPHVAGTVALILTTTAPSTDGWTFSDVYSALQGSVVDLGATGLDYAYGWGRINAHDSL